MENPDTPEAPQVPSVLVSSVFCNSLAAPVPNCSVPSKKTPMLNGATRAEEIRKRDKSFVQAEHLL